MWDENGPLNTVHAHMTCFRTWMDARACLLLDQTGAADIVLSLYTLISIILSWQDPCIQIIAWFHFHGRYRLFLYKIKKNITFMYF